MAKIHRFVRFWSFGLLVLGLALILTGCRKPEEPPAAASVTEEAPPPPPPPAQEGLKMKVKIVEVTIDGGKVSVDQQRVRLKKNQDIVIWVTNGESMTITWKADNPPPGNPLPRLACEGRFCGTLVPSDAPPGVYKYTVTVDGESLDPEVEVEG